jgi:hypothetical protein
VGIVAALVVGLVAGVASNFGTTTFQSADTGTVAPVTVTVTATPDPGISGAPTSTDTPTPSSEPDTDTDTSSATADPNADIPGDGTYAVGSDVQPGTYHASGGDSCTWQRLAQNRSGEEHVVASGSGSSVTIRESDSSFETEGCGSWSRGG